MSWLMSIVLITAVFVSGSLIPGWIRYAMILTGMYLVWNCFQSDLKLSLGTKQRKRKTQVLLALYYLMLLVGVRFSWVYAYLLYFPIAMAMLYVRVRWVWIAFHFALTVGHIAYFYPGLWLGAALVLGLWLLFSFLILAMNKRMILDLKRKLSVYERESRKYLQDTDVSSLGIEEKRITQAVGRINQEKEQFRNLTNVLFEIFIPKTCAFYVYEPLEEIFIPKSFQTQSEDFDEHTLMPNEGIFRLAETAKKTMQIYDNAIPSLLYYKKRPRIESVLLCPIVEDGRLYGVLVIDHEKKKQYSSHELSVVERIAQHFYHILTDSKVLAQYDHLKEEFSSFYQASSALNRAFHLQEVLESMLHMAKSIAPYDWGSVVLYNKEINKNMVVLDSESDLHHIVGQTFTLSYKKGSVSWVVDQLKPLHYNNFKQKFKHTPLFHQKIQLPNRYDSVFILPLYVQEEKIGCILLMSEKNYFFTRVIQSMLEVLAFQASIAIKNAISVAHLEKLATTDGLTGVINHRAFQEELKAELDRAKRYGHELSMMLIDLDFFKKINDEYGHPAGDFVLKNTAAFIKDQVRTTDLVARYGGEEFSVILPNTTSKQSLDLAKRMIEAIHKITWNYNGIEIPVTFSIGIASFPEHADHQSVLVEHADQALYHAKNNGRDVACVFEKHMMIKDDMHLPDQQISKTERRLHD